jgi:glycosyltransferase involved in cell wall biosynthesis
LIIEVHGPYVPSRRSQAGARPVLSRAARCAEIPVLRLADHVLAQAMTMRDRLVRMGLRPGRITVLYPGVQTAEFSEHSEVSVEVPGAVEGEKIVLYVGSTERFQGLDLLAAAQRDLPPGFRIVLVISSDAGESGDVLGSFGFDAKRTTVIHPGGSGVIPAWCQRADVLVHARPDVLANMNVQSKLGFYLAAGRPIATTNVGDYPALLGESRGCVLTRPEARAFAGGIVEATRAEVVAAAAERNPGIARRHFEADSNVRRLVALYEVLMGGQSKASAERGSDGPP